MEDDFEDLLGIDDGQGELLDVEEGGGTTTIEGLGSPEVEMLLPGEGTTELDGDVELGTVEAEQTMLDMAAMPSENELRLGKKVLELEKERDTLATELSTLKARFPSHSTIIPIPDSSSSSAPPISPAEVRIPSEIMPILSLLRNHISDLTRENQAFRYIFLGKPEISLPLPGSGTLALSSRTTLDTPLQQATGGTASATPLLSPTPTGIATTVGLGGIPVTQASASLGIGTGLGVDLETVLNRMKELIKENEELGEMLLEAGRAGGEEWMKALDESKAVIASLESDLTHHLKTIESLRAELAIHQTQSGPLSALPVLSPDPPSNPASVSSGRPSSSTHATERNHKSSTSRRESERHSHSHSIRSHREHGESVTRSKSGSRDRHRDYDRDEDRDRASGRSAAQSGLAGGTGKRHERDSLSRHDTGSKVETASRRSDTSNVTGPNVVIEGQSQPRNIGEGARGRVMGLSIRGAGSGASNRGGGQSNGVGHGSGGTARGKIEDDRAYKRRR